MGSQRVEHKLAAEQQQSKRAGIWREGRRENRRFPGKVTELYQPYEMVIVKRNAIDGYSYSDRIICFSAHPPSLKKKKVKVKVLVTQLCSILCDLSRPSRLLCPWNSPGQNTGVGSHFLLQGIFPTWASNLGLLHCRQILYLLSRQGSPIVSNKCHKIWGEPKLPEGSTRKKHR